MKKRLKNSLLRELIAITVFIMLLLMGAFALTNGYSNRVLRGKNIELNEKIMLQVEGKLDKYYETINHVVTAMVYSPITYNYFSMDSVNRVLVSEDLSDVFSNTVLLENDIAGIYLYDMSMNRIAAMGKAADDLNESLSMEEDMEFGNMFYMNQAGIPYYSVYFPVFDLNNRKYGVQMGACLLLMRTDGLSGLLEDSQATKNTQVFLLDGNNRVLASRGDSGREYLESEDMYSTDEYYVKTQKAKMDNWKVVSRVPVREMYDGSEGGRGFVITAYVLALVLLVLLIWFCYYRLVRPIYRVDTFIRRIVEQPEERMEAEREDEIGTVVKSLNQMLDEQQNLNKKIQESQKRMYEAELAKKQLQVLAYRNQINPHFLYNTFECICSMALYYEVEDIAEITMALSNVFRFAVKGNNIVSVEEEVTYIREYAKIIDYRFMGRIDVDIQMEEEVKKKKVIKLILQPIVENAVFHGLEQCIEGGEVDVSIRMKDESHIEFLVEDNGCGIEPAKLVWMRDNLDSPAANKKGIGVANIYQRLRLFYGEDVEFAIESRVGEGTRITIVIPDEIREGGNENVQGVFGG